MARSARGALRAAAWAPFPRRIASAFKSHGGEIITDAPVERVIVRSGKVSGVALANGNEYHAKIVVSNLDPKRTFTKLFDDKDLSPAFMKRARNFKIRGSSGKLNIALDGLPEFTALGRDNPLRFGDMHFLDSLEKMERAYDDWKSGTWSKEPYLDLLIPSMTDPTMTPAGQALDVGVRAVRAGADPRSRLDRRGSRRLQEHGARPDRALQPELQAADPPCRSAHAARTRERSGPDRGQHLPGRADHGPADVQPSVPGLTRSIAARSAVSTCAARARIRAAA